MSHILIGGIETLNLAKNYIGRMDEHECVESGQYTKHQEKFHKPTYTGLFRQMQA